MYGELEIAGPHLPRGYRAGGDTHGSVDERVRAVVREWEAASGRPVPTDVVTTRSRVALVKLDSGRQLALVSLETGELLKSWYGRAAGGGEGVYAGTLLAVVGAGVAVLLLVKPSFGIGCLVSLGILAWRATKKKRGTPPPHDLDPVRADWDETKPPGFLSHWFR